LRSGGKVVPLPRTVTISLQRSAYAFFAAPSAASTRRERSEDEFDTLVTVEFHARGSSTDVVFVHELLESEASRVNHECGWTGIFDKLAAYLAS
jgi:uncharacterized protein YndB with AHSA1/START domain